jgi:hypothetical protein
MQEKKIVLRKWGLPLTLIIVQLLVIACAGFTTSGSDNQTITELQAEISRLSTHAANQDAIISHLATQVRPLTGQPELPHPTFTPYLPIIGVIHIDDDSCCVGGTAGDMVDINVFLEVQNIEQVEVLEMRLVHGGAPPAPLEMENALWEPYLSSVIITIPVITNWTNYHVCAQFRDTSGYISEMACDNIAVEGHPASTGP